MGLPQRDKDDHTYGEYLTWPEDVRYELIDGVAFLMAPAPQSSSLTSARTRPVALSRSRVNRRQCSLPSIR